MVYVISMVFSDRLSRTAVKWKYQIIGLNTEIHGKSKELIFNTRSISVVRLERPSITRATNDHIGKKLKLF